MKAGDRVRLVSLKDKRKLAAYYREPPCKVGDVGKLLHEDQPGIFICGFLNYALVVNASMVKVIRAV